MHKAKLLRIHFSAGDRFENNPLYEAIVEKCRERNIAGATVFRGLEGYGETGSIHESIIVIIVDSEERISGLLPVVEEMMDTGLLATSEVEMMRLG